MSETAAAQCRWRLRPGEYLGEISALCFLQLPHHLPSLPFLLAGTGSQIQVYDLNTGKIIRSFQVFEGIRVHGICLEYLHQRSKNFHLVFQVAVFGERRVKIFNLQIESLELKPSFHLKLVPVIPLPKFTHWVLDVRFLKEGASSDEDSHYLAIGCSDNSVRFWNIPEQNMFSEVKCSESCLLYSMAMFGNKIESLFIASGTIFNEIVVWKVSCQNQAVPLETDDGDSCRLTINGSLLSPTYEDVIMSRLVGHEGSIFRITWFSSGMKLVSVSDDRSARIWEVQVGSEQLCGPEKVNYIAGPVLFGHNGRIWDCCIFDSLIITAGEDCTFRVWNQDGQGLNEIKEHIGRGVWRCLCDPKSSLLVTAGFDSAIRVHQLIKSSKGSQMPLAASNSSDQEDLFTLYMPNNPGHELLDSKSEYIRCLHLANKDSLYVATNNGYLYHISLLKSNDFVWTKLSHICKDAPIICMDILSTFNNLSDGSEDWIALGDGKGNMTVILVVGNYQSFKVETTVSWKAEKERNLLGSFWCKSLQNSFIFTANPGGKVRLWKLCYDSPFASQTFEDHHVFLIAEFVSCFGTRILCMVASYDEELLVCGDSRGNLMLFSLPEDLLCSSSGTTEMEALPICHFKGAHGVSSVRSVSIASLPFDEVEICSTGADGCICYLRHSRDLRNLEFVGMEQVKELSAVQSVHDTSTGKHAVGFVSSNFMIWNLTTASKVLQITCGGWRRPTSCFVGYIPEIMSCFAFVKDDVIFVHRRWLSEIDQQLYPRNIHLQFHGREIHSLCFICGNPLFNLDNIQGPVPESCWIVTGCEDGTMRLTRYEPGTYKWCSSELLGVHVAGSAIRSICSVSAVHLYFPDSADESERVYAETENRDTCLLISVGAKRVVSVWKKVSAIPGSNSGNGNKTVENKNRSTFQWLSTDIPVSDARHRSRHELINECAEKDKQLGTTSVCNGVSFSSKGKNEESELHPGINHDDDFRHLAVTAFLVKEVCSRISVCFVIIASSDATVTMRALVLPLRIWFDVATLASTTSSPVLSVRHLVVHRLPFSKGNLYLALTGSTDGSVLIWDLTASVENFMMHVSGFPTGNCSGPQKRPQTGRGSQGGRRWRSVVDSSRYANAKTKNSVVTENHDEDGFPESACAVAVEASHVFRNMHQSGVNCLHVSEVKNADSTTSLCGVTGGDDQAINYFRCDILLIPGSLATTPRIDRITSAHSSAVKGVWTDGMWVFSVGLDQRVRCWVVGDDGKMDECGHLIVSVPEPEAVDVVKTRNGYEVGVAGRGMQIVEFFRPV